MTLWNDMIIGICLLLTGWLVWKEFRRPDRSRLTLRIVASVVAVISLACLVLPPSYRVKRREGSSGKEGVLLTEGYDPDSLRQFLQAARAGGAGSIPGNLKVFSIADGSALLEVAADGPLPDTKSARGKRTARTKGDDTSGAVPGTDSAAMNKLSKLHVLGYGLTRKEWTSLHPPPLVFHPSPSPAGILSVSWKEKVTSGEKLRIQGSVALPPGRPVKLLLTGMGLPLDSVLIRPGTREKSVSGSDTTQGGASAGQIDFELNTIPAQSGRSVYRLWVLSGRNTGIVTSSGRDADTATASRANTRMDTLEQEAIPIEVLPAKKLRILLLAASPDFENTFLVNWLSRSGQGVATQTIISKGKSYKAFLNMPETPLEPLTSAVLDKFDLVIADAAILQSGNTAEQANLRRQIAEKGLGLIIKADSMAAGPGITNSPAGDAFYKDLFPLETVKDSTQRLYIKERPGAQPLLRDSSFRILVSSGLYGSGKLIFTTLNKTWSRMLSGEKKEYAAYWSMILRKAARDAEPGEDWQFTPDLPRVDEPVEALLQTNKSGLPQGQFGSTDNFRSAKKFGSVDDRTDSGSVTSSALAIYLAQSPLMPFQWQGTYWPAEAGWQSSATLQGEPDWWYAWSAEDWCSLRRRQRWTETKEYMAEQGTISPDSGNRPPIPPDQNTVPQDTDSHQVPVSPAWFYALFISSCLFLWVERKI